MCLMIYKDLCRAGPWTHLTGCINQLLYIDIIYYYMSLYVYILFALSCFYLLWLANFAYLHHIPWKHRIIIRSSWVQTLWHYAQSTWAGYVVGLNEIAELIASYGADNERRQRWRLMIFEQLIGLLSSLSGTKPATSNRAPKMGAHKSQRRWLKIWRTPAEKSSHDAPAEFSMTSSSQRIKKNKNEPSICSISSGHTLPAGAIGVVMENVVSSRLPCSDFEGRSVWSVHLEHPPCWMFHQIGSHSTRQKTPGSNGWKRKASKWRGLGSIDVLSSCLFFSWYPLVN